MAVVGAYLLRFTHQNLFGRFTSHINGKLVKRIFCTLLEFLKYRLYFHRCHFAVCIIFYRSSKDFFSNSLSLSFRSLCILASSLAALTLVSNQGKGLPHAMQNRGASIESSPIHMRRIGVPSNRSFTVRAFSDSWLTTNLAILLVMFWFAFCTVVSYVAVLANLSNIVGCHVIR